MKTPAQHLRDALQASPTPDRRRFLAGLGALPLLGAAASAPLPASAAVKTQARIVIAGGGAAGLTAASRLSTLLEGASITIVDARKEHYYQPMN